MSHCSMGPPCLPISLIALLATGLLCCKQEAPSTAAPSAPEVEVVDVVQKDVPIYSESVGSTDGMVNAVIKAQVNGYLMKRSYVEGAFVKKGQVLFEIDPRKFQAALDQAKGEWEKARAQFVKTDLDVKRDTPLAEGGAISRKELDDSIQANRAAKASVASAKASVDQASLNLSFTQIIAPIDGVVGIAKAQIGDLVGLGDDPALISSPQGSRRSAELPAPHDAQTGPRVVDGAHLVVDEPGRESDLPHDVLRHIRRRIANTSPLRRRPPRP